ncbi:MAG: molecular chaperone DnaK [bacterium]|nr:molecular chaperone DnaK [bacterium]
MAKIIGIDLGTSNSAASVLEGGKPTIIPSAEGTSIGGKSFPSYVAFSKEGELLVGEPARRQAVVNSGNTVQAAKRKMGENHKFQVGGKEYTPQQISGFILQKIKKDAEAFLGDTIEKAVVTVPAYFNDNQRQATKDAGTIAGLKIVRIINEPTAAALSYGLDKDETEKKVMVFDLGGGTLDVTIMEMAHGVFEVKSTSGDTKLGGTDMDLAIIDYIAQNFKNETGIDLKTDEMALQRVREAAEKAKIELSTTLETDINLPFISADQAGPKHLNMKFKRSKLEELVNPIVKKCEGPIKQAISDAGLQFSNIDNIIMVGGPTRMPIVQQEVETFVGKKVERGVDPMECVSMGAAIQAGVLTGEVKDVLLLDVTPLSLGLETLGGVCTKLIEKNTTVPTKKSQVFSTAADNQTAVSIRVLQGERSIANDNVELGKFDLIGIPAAPRGVPQVEVSFDIDANGIIHVSAKDLGTNKEQSIKITASSKLSEEDIEKMIKDADAFADEDKKRKERIEAQNTAENLIYQTEKSLKENGDKISDEEKAGIETAKTDLAEALKAKEIDVESVKAKTETLQQASHKLAEAIYKDAAAAQEASQSENADKDSNNAETKDENKKDDDNVVDADFEEGEDK